jgi:hypothetical protein
VVTDLRTVAAEAPLDAVHIFGHTFDYDRAWQAFGHPDRS